MNLLKRTESHTTPDDMEKLRKLFIMPDTPDRFIEFGQELLDLIHNFYSEQGSIHSSISLQELEKLFSDIDIPRSPQLLKDVLNEIKEKIVSHSVKVGSPYYVGHMTSAVPYFMILLEMIVAALNQNQVKIESAKASTFVERELIAWMHRLIFQKSQRFYKQNIQNRDILLGTATTDGTMANLTAMLVARNRAFPPSEGFTGIRKAGIFEAFRHYDYSRAVILVSRRGHYSFDKIARILGIGDESIVRIPVDERNKMDIVELEKKCRQIAEHNARGRDRIKILSIIGIAGTTETGNIDNLTEIRRIATEYDAHFHVDAAWGGSLLLVNEFRYLFGGIEKADSVTVDAHKLMYNPVSMGMVFFRNREDMDHLKHSSNYIIRPDSVDLGRFSVEGSRPFAALKTWATLKILGIQGFRSLFEHAFRLTSVLRGHVDIHYNFEAMNQPELFIFNYRFVPGKVQARMESMMLKIRTLEEEEGTESRTRMKLIEKIRQLNIALNDLNIELHKAIREEDESFVSRTMINCPRYFEENIVILRAILINPITTPEMLRGILDDQNRLGERICQNDFNSRLERLL